MLSCKFLLFLPRLNEPSWTQTSRAHYLLSLATGTGLGGNSRMVGGEIRRGAWCDGKNLPLCKWWWAFPALKQCFSVTVYYYLYLYNHSIIAAPRWLSSGEVNHGVLQERATSLCLEEEWYNFVSRSYMLLRKCLVDMFSVASGSLSGVHIYVPLCFPPAVSPLTFRLQALGGQEHTLVLGVCTR